MAYLIKSLGSSAKPYTMDRHLKENHGVIGFSQPANVTSGDTLFLYAVGPGKFFGIVTMLGWLDQSFEDEYYGHKAKVFVNAMVYDLDKAPDINEVFPLPSGINTMSLRQHSHIFIEPEDAKVLTKEIMKAAKKELP